MAQAFINVDWFKATIKGHPNGFPCGRCACLIPDGGTYWTKNGQVVCDDCYTKGANFATSAATTAPVKPKGVVRKWLPDVIIVPNMDCHVCRARITIHSHVGVGVLGGVKVYCCGSCYTAVRGKSTPPTQTSNPHWTKDTLLVDMECDHCKVKQFNGSHIWLSVVGGKSAHICISCYRSLPNSTLKATRLLAQRKANPGPLVKVDWRQNTAVTGDNCTGCTAPIKGGTKFWFIYTGKGIRNIYCNWCHHIKTGGVTTTSTISNSRYGSQSQEALSAKAAQMHPREWEGYEHIELYTTPTKEQCACFGMPRYDERAEKEIGKWRYQLRQTFGKPPELSRFHPDFIMHKVGGKELVLRYFFDPKNKSHLAFAEQLKVLPERWTDS